MNNPSVVIITPSIGKQTLSLCMESVKAQTYPNVRHLVVIDGGEYYTSVIDNVTVPQGSYNLDVCILPRNVGKDGWYGHRIYAAMPFLCDEDYVIFLDEDNWIEPNHVQSLMEVILNGKLWSYCLRNIMNTDSNFICRDDCESLGKWVGVGNYYHIDTSCYCVPRKILADEGLAKNWYGKWGQDRVFFSDLKWYTDARFYTFGCTGEYTLNYRLGGNEGSVKREFFEAGNKIMENIYSPDKFPWSK